MASEDTNPVRGKNEHGVPPVPDSLILYRGIASDELVRDCVSVITAPFPMDLRQRELPEESERALERIRAALAQATGRLIEAAYKYGWSGNLWQAYLTDCLINDENAFTLAVERRSLETSSVRQAAAHDLQLIGSWFDYDWNQLAEWLEVPALRYIAHYEADKAHSLVYNRRVAERIAELKTALDKACAVQDAGTGLRVRTLLEQFHLVMGTGVIGLHKAFRVREKAGKAFIEPIRAIPHVRLSDLIGYESAKQKLIDNTEAFLEEKPANNCLLYGDAGTGKSSCIKAITDRYYERGLRVIELYKHQSGLLHQVIDQIKNRNYRFIVYMDDLSFEDFETEYKYLKAVIEGGLEKKPENLLIYATSNRRHLIRENFSDKEDDIHRGDTVQEKLSLAYRFGVTIYFGTPGKEEYEEIVLALADRAGLAFDREELVKEASRWEMTHGGRSGRTATQFIDHLAGNA